MLHDLMSGEGSSSSVTCKPSLSYSNQIFNQAHFPPMSNSHFPISLELIRANINVEVGCLIYACSCDAHGQIYGMTFLKC
mmetsp:Transcript_24179/g.46309  ORF Transcript_24179/g.46309 Transcript_24179/m.46309 type:complete len:80 (+) Transcript_24179:172-411(+)